MPSWLFAPPLIIGGVTEKCDDTAHWSVADQVVIVCAWRVCVYVCCEDAFIVPQKLGRSRGSVCFTFSASPLFYWWRGEGINAVDPERLHRRLSCCASRACRVSRVLCCWMFIVLSWKTCPKIFKTTTEFRRKHWFICVACCVMCLMFGCCCCCHCIVCCVFVYCVVCCCYVLLCAFVFRILFYILCCGSFFVPNKSALQTKCKLIVTSLLALSRMVAVE